MKEIIGFISAIGWVAGVVIAKGFWSTLFAVCIPFWSWYLVIERVITTFNL